MPQYIFIGATIFICMVLGLRKMSRKNEGLALFFTVLTAPIWIPLSVCFHVLGAVVIYLGVVVLFILGTGAIVLLTKLCELYC